MSQISYVYPNFASVRDFGLFRIGGSGLANCLLSWARASVFADRTGSQRIAGTWPSIRLGPLLRGERDVRLYTGLFETEADAIGGLRKLALLATLPKRRIILPTDVDIIEPGVVYVVDGSCIVPYYFQGLRDHRDELKRRLLVMTRRKSERLAADHSGADIAVHVRTRGFFPGRLCWHAGHAILQHSNSGRVVRGSN